MRQPGTRLLYGVLGVLTIALAVLGGRAWQVFGSPQSAPPSVTTVEPSARSAPPSFAESAAVPDEPGPATAPRTVTPAASPTGARPAPLPPPTARRARSVATSTGSLRGLVIALDPGHNGGNVRHPAQIARLVDAGGFRKACNTTGTAAHDGYAEATFTWELAQRLAALLTARGAEVRMTRSDNGGVGPCVDVRGRFGATVGARVQVSLHADGAPPGAHGFHVITPALKRGYTDDILPASQRLGAALRDSVRGAGFSPSNYIGSRGLDTRSDLGTLNRADVPTAMIECGNLRNAADAARLRSPAGQHRLAVGLADGLARHLLVAGG